MTPENTELIRDTIIQSVGADVEVVPNKVAKRKGLDVWFRPWEKEEGPIFQIKPIGLKSHRVTMFLGSKSGIVLKKIATRTAEQTGFANAILSTIAPTMLTSKDPILEITAGTRWEAQVRGIESQYEDEPIKRTTVELMVPMIAAMAELIGFKDVDSPFDKEGALLKSEIQRRERSSRNRFLALELHGYKCVVCGFDPIKYFGQNLGKIIEVHHVEPLSNLSEPREYNPSTDLITLCPNCHRMIHTKTPPYSPEELKVLLSV